METRPLGRFIGDYPIERLLVDSIRSRLTVEENLARDFIMEFIINFQQPCPLPLAVSQLRLQKPELEWDKIITSLLDKRMVVCSEDLLAEFVYPVSAEPTSHEVTLKDGRHFYAMCAVDALGSAFTFHQDTQIRSVCAECGQPISIVINNGLLTSMAPTDPYVLYTDHGSAENWTGSTWNIMNFFCTKKHYDVWVDKREISNNNIFQLRADEAIIVAKMLLGE